MINNDYTLSIRICLKARGIDNIFDFCLIKASIKKEYKVFRPALYNRMQVSLLMSSANYKVEKESFLYVIEQAKMMLIKITEALKIEKRKNVIATLLVLCTELDSLIKLLE